MSVRDWVAAAFLAMPLVGSAHAGVVATALQVGADVVISYSGSLDLTGVNPLLASYNDDRRQVVPDGGQFVFISGPASSFEATPLPDYGAPSIFLQTPAAAGLSGDPFGLTSAAVALPVGYTSLDAIAGSATFFNTSIAAMGMEPGTYVTSLASSDTITLTIPDVPVPASLPLLFVGLGGLVLWRRRAS